MPIIEKELKQKIGEVLSKIDPKARWESEILSEKKNKKNRLMAIIIRRKK